MISILMFAAALGAMNWPQAGGPNGTWSTDGGKPPIHWSVVRNGI
jgi:hypothetical protein